MVGRKRKQTRRQPNGQPVRERGIDPRAIAALQPHRRSVPREVMHDPKAESVMGRLRLNGWITEIEYQAGVKYREIVMRYRVVIDAPRASEASMSGVIVGPWGGNYELDENEVERRRANYNAAYEWLESTAGNAAARAVAHCAVHERRGFIIRHLKSGLEALAEHFGLTRVGNSARRNK